MDKEVDKSKISIQGPYIRPEAVKSSSIVGS